jgi:hypothetical protein
MSGEVAGLTFGRFLELLIVWTLAHARTTFVIS